MAQAASPALHEKSCRGRAVGDAVGPAQAVGSRVVIERDADRSDVALVDGHRRSPVPTESSKTSLSPGMNVVFVPPGWRVQALPARQSDCVPFQ